VCKAICLQIFTEFTLSAAPPDRRSELLRLYNFIASPSVLRVLIAQLTLNFALSDFVASFLGFSYHATASAVTNATAAATGIVGAAFVLATGAAITSLSCFIFTCVTAACSLPLSLMVYGCFLNSGHRLCHVLPLSRKR
jgi:hypothetical protein